MLVALLFLAMGGVVAYTVSVSRRQRELEMNLRMMDVRCDLLNLKINSLLCNNKHY